MSTTLLTTKLNIPPHCTNLVQRPHLTKRIRTDAPVKLTLVTAPAGFGKTTLVTSWISQSIPQAYKEQVAWLSLNAADNTLVQFWSYVIAALQQVEETIGKALQKSLHTTSNFPPVETVLTSLINEISRKASPFILVFDDYHEITNPEIHQSMSFLIDHMPSNVHLILLSREDLPFSISRYRVRGQLNEIRAADLRFSEKESTTFFNDLLTMSLSDKDIQILNGRTEGWAAGLHLAALSMHTIEDRSNFIREFAGSHRFLTDYLVDEVLSRQSKTVQKFLLRTSILNHFCSEVCDELVEIPNSKTIIAELEQANLFILPLDNERKWFRYHHLFAEFLRLRLHETEPELIRELYLRAEKWFTQAGLLREALQYALHIQDYKQAAGLIETMAPDILEQDNPTLLIQWSQELPNDILHQRHFLCAYLGTAYVFTGQIEAADQWFSTAQTRVSHASPEEKENLQGYIWAHRAYVLILQGDYQSGITIANQALELLPQTDTVLRASTICHLGGAYNYCGNLKQAKDAYQQGITIAKKIGSIPLAQLSYCGLGETLREQGRLTNAIDTYQQFLDFAKERTGMDQPPLTGNAVLEIGAIHREWYHLDTALEYVIQGIDLCRKWQQGVELAIGLLELAEIHRLRGEFSEAETTLKEVRQIAEDISPWAKNLVEGIAARLLVDQKKLTALVHWAEDANLMNDGCELGYERFPECPALIRMYINIGEPKKALVLTEKLLERDEEAGRMGRVLDLRILKFAALDEMGETTQAAKVLEETIGLAAPENHLRPFAEEISRLAPYFHKGKTSPFRNRILKMLGEPTSNNEMSSALVEPLNEREISILRMMSSGQTNREIGESLFLSVNTIRWYASQIYQKLGAKNRSAAVAKGRELGLIH